MENNMNEVFLALKPCDNTPITQGTTWVNISTNSAQVLSPEKIFGNLSAKFFNDISMIPNLVKERWEIFRMNGLQRVVDIVLELKMEKKDDCNESTKSDNECGR